IHHFKPAQVKCVLKNAVDNNVPIAIFDGGDKSIFGILGIIIIHPIAIFLFTPFFKPFKFSRLFFTYIIPMIPLYTVLDGCVSIMRLYSPGELLKISKAVSPDKFKWSAGKTKNRFGLHATYLIGVPNE